MVIGYDMNFLSRQIIGLMLKTDSVNLVNLITGNRSIPECIGSNLNSDNLFWKWLGLFKQSKAN